MEKVETGKFDFNDFLKQYEMMTNMGPMGQMMKMIPGANKISNDQMIKAEKEMEKFKEMIAAMSEDERSNPDLLASDKTRRMRVAEESNRTEQEVSQLVAQFSGMREYMQQAQKQL